MGQYGLNTQTITPSIIHPHLFSLFKILHADCRNRQPVYVECIEIKCPTDRAGHLCRPATRCHRFASVHTAESRRVQVGQFPVSHTVLFEAKRSTDCEITSNTTSKHIKVRESHDSNKSVGLFYLAPAEVACELGFVVCLGCN